MSRVSRVSRAALAAQDGDVRAPEVGVGDDPGRQRERGGRDGDASGRRARAKDGDGPALLAERHGDHPVRPLRARFDHDVVALAHSDQQRICLDRLNRRSVGVGHGEGMALDEEAEGGVGAAFTSRSRTLSRRRTTSRWGSSGGLPLMR